MKFKALKTKLKEDNITFYTITIDEFECLLRRPNRNELTVITQMMTKNQIGGAQYLFKNCWLGGDKQIVEDTELFLSAMGVIDSLFELKEATIKPVNGNQFKITVENKSCIIKKPTISDLSVIMSFAEKNPIKSNEEYLNRCWVSGDEEIKTNDDYFLSASSVLDSVIQIKQSTIKKN